MNPWNRVVFPWLIIVSLSFVSARYGGFPSIRSSWSGELTSSEQAKENAGFVYNVNELITAEPTALTERFVDAILCKDDQIRRITGTPTAAASPGAVTLHHADLVSRVLAQAVSKLTTSEANSKKTLDLTANSFSAATIRTVGSLVSRLASLEVLVLDGNDLSNTEDLRAIIFSLRKHPSIKKIYLSGCSLDDDSMDAIAYMLRMNHRITHLDISNNHISSAGLSKLLQAGSATARSSRKIPQSVSSGDKKMKQQQKQQQPPSESIDSCDKALDANALVMLDVSYNPLMDAGLLKLATAMEYNQYPKMMHLLVKEVGASGASVERLLQSISHKSHIQHIDVSGNSLLAAPGSSSSNSGIKHTINGRKQNKLEKLMTKGAQKFEKMIPSSVTGAMKSAAASIGWPSESSSTEEKKSPLRVKFEVTGSTKSRRKRGSTSDRSKDKKRSSRSRGNKGKRISERRVVDIPERQLARTIVSALCSTSNLTTISIASCGLNNRFCSEFQIAARTAATTTVITPIAARTNVAIDATLNDDIDIASNEQIRNGLNILFNLS